RPTNRVYAVTTPDQLPAPTVLRGNFLLFSSVANVLIDTNEIFKKNISKHLVRAFGVEEKRSREKKTSSGEVQHESDPTLPHLILAPWRTFEEVESPEIWTKGCWKVSLQGTQMSRFSILNRRIQIWQIVLKTDFFERRIITSRAPLFRVLPCLLLVNKFEFMPQVEWAKYFHLHVILFVFWSAKAVSAALERKQLRFPVEIQNSLQDSDDADTKIFGREELLARLKFEAEEIAMTRRKTHSSSAHCENVAGNIASKSVMVGFVGYPNVGKSSTINALVGEKRTELTLCGCPGLVFPSFTSSRYEMIASGVLLIDQMTEHMEAVQVVANRVPRHIIEDVYRITLPKPKSYESQSRPPLASKLLRAYCASQGYVAPSGLPDETKAARQILKDYIDGKLPHFEMSPGKSNNEASMEVTDAPSSSEMHESDLSDTENPPSSEDEKTTPNLEHVLIDLNSFDMANDYVLGRSLRRKTVKMHLINSTGSLRGKKTGHRGSGVRMVMECQ
ncbi:GTPase LSG1-2, partial [Camellia lanceoleosa]